MFAIAAAAASGCTPVRAAGTPEPFIPILTVAERAELEHVLDHLLPSEPGSPGAKEIAAAEYIERSLAAADADPDRLALARRGLASLETDSAKEHGKPVASLAPGELESLLRAYEATSEGDDFLHLVMTYTLEAYVGDPVYGGNPDGSVWKYLGYAPAQPRPPVPFMKEI